MNELNITEVVAEVTTAFKRYEEALRINDVATLDELFWDNPLVLRYGPNGTLQGHAAISAFRHSSLSGVERTLRNTVITTFGRDFATANTESTKNNSNLIGRQSQTWIRMPEGWRIVAAHFSNHPKQGRDQTMVQSNNPLTAYIEQAAALLGVPLSDEYLPTIVLQFEAFLALNDMLEHSESADPPHHGGVRP